METGPPAAGVKPLATGMRLNLLIGSLLPLLAGLSLFVGTSDTDTTSAWTIKSKITAATIGAAYWAGFFLTFLSGMERTWARARIAVPAVLVFTILGFVSTAIDFDRFHTDEGGVGTQFLTWLWLVPYALGPLLIVTLLILQLRVPGGDPPREAPLPQWTRIALGAQAAVLGGVGIALFVAPVDVSEAIWPWDLTELTGRVIAAWLIALAVGTVHVIVENDWARSRPASVAYTLFGALEIVVLLRYTDEVDGSARLWLYIAFLVSIIALGAYGWRSARRDRARPRRRPPRRRSRERSPGGAARRLTLTAARSWAGLARRGLSPCSARDAQRALCTPRPLAGNPLLPRRHKDLSPLAKERAFLGRELEDRRSSCSEGDVVVGRVKHPRPPPRIAQARPPAAADPRLAATGDPHARHAAAREPERAALGHSGRAVVERESLYALAVDHLDVDKVERSFILPSDRLAAAVDESVGRVVVGADAIPA